MEVLNPKTKRNNKVNGPTFTNLIERKYDYIQDYNKFIPKESPIEFIY